MKDPIVVGLSGASGVIIGVETLRVLRELGIASHAVISEAAARTLQLETPYRLEDVRQLANKVYSNKDIGAAIASGSMPTAGMIIAPCSIKTLSAVANSYGESLLSRAADVTLKEGRKLVLMVRETPLHKGHLKLMAQAADIGAVILPPMPAFYQRPRDLDEMVRHLVGKVLDQFAIDHGLYAPWQGRSVAHPLPVKAT